MIALDQGGIGWQVLIGFGTFHLSCSHVSLQTKITQTLHLPFSFDIHWISNATYRCVSTEKWFPFMHNHYMAFVSFSLLEAIRVYKLLHRFFAILFACIQRSQLFVYFSSPFFPFATLSCPFSFTPMLINAFALLCVCIVCITCFDMIWSESDVI